MYFLALSFDLYVIFMPNKDVRCHSKMASDNLILCIYDRKKYIRSVSYRVPSVVVFNEQSCCILCDVVW